MRRREFIALVGGAVTWPLAGRAQTPLPIVGLLSAASPSDTFVVIGFNRGLSEAGFEDGKNVIIEYRWAHGRHDRLPALAADLVARKVAAIAAVGGPNSGLAAKAATSNIPIVFISATDPVEIGLVTSLNRPLGNVTGVYMLGTLLNAKRLELLRELIPTPALVAMLVNPTRASTQIDVREIQAAADRIGQKIEFFNVSTDGEIDATFATLVEKRVGGLIVHGDPFFTSRHEQFAVLTTRHAIPTIFAWRQFPAAGGLISYGPSLQNAYSQVGLYVGRILKGAKPAELPVVQSTTFELVVNLTTAKALGLTVPQSILLRADEVIE
jgi:ABC-type uncharacterized transport system substrate-binding protein